MPLTEVVKGLLFIYVFNNFMYFGMCWISIAARSFLWLQRAGAALQLRCTGFSLWWLLLGQSTSSRACGLSRCGAPALRAQAQQLRHMGLAALCHVGSSQAGDWTCVSCLGSWILYHWVIREAPMKGLLKKTKRSLGQLWSGFWIKKSHLKW